MISTTSTEWISLQYDVHILVIIGIIIVLFTVLDFVRRLSMPNRH